MGDLGDSRHLGRRSGDEAFRKPRDLVRHDAPLGYLDASAAGELDRRAPGYAVEEAIRDRGVDAAIFDEKDIGAGAFGDLSAPVEHHRVGIALALSLVLGNGAG